MLWPATLNRIDPTYLSTPRASFARRRLSSRARIRTPCTHQRAGAVHQGNVRRSAYRGTSDLERALESRRADVDIGTILLVRRPRERHEHASGAATRGTPTGTAKATSSQTSSAAGAVTHEPRRSVPNRGNVSHRISELSEILLLIARRERLHSEISLGPVLCEPGFSKPVAALAFIAKPSPPARERWVQSSRSRRPKPAIGSAMPQRRSACQTIAGFAATTVTSSSRSMSSIASATAQ